MKILAFNSLKCPWSVTIKMQQTPLKFLPRAKWVGISTWLLPMHNKRQPHEKMISNKRSYASGLQSEAFDIRRIMVIVKSVQNNRQMDVGFYERSFPSRWKCDWSAISGIGLSRDAINHKRNHCFPMRTCNLTKYHGVKHLIRVLMFWSFFPVLFFFNALFVWFWERTSFMDKLQAFSTSWYTKIRLLCNRFIGILRERKNTQQSALSGKGILINRPRSRT